MKNVFFRNRKILYSSNNKKQEKNIEINIDSPYFIGHCINFFAIEIL